MKIVFVSMIVIPTIIGGILNPPVLLIGIPLVVMTVLPILES